MKELSPELQAQVYGIVNLAEARFINALFAWETSAKHRSENCKCPQCLHEPKRASEAIQKELERISPTPEETQAEQDNDYATKRTLLRK